MLSLKARLGGGVYFWDPEKSMCQTTGKHVDAWTPQMPLAKMNYFPKDEGEAHQFFITTGWIERFAQ